MSKHDAASPLLEVKDLGVAFGSKTVVHDVSFNIGAGEKLALVGESGSGKTVTALALLRLLSEAKLSGHALFNADGQTRDLISLPERALRGLRGDEIAMIFQEPMTALNPLMTVGEQIAEVLRIKRDLSGEALRQATVDLLDSTGIPEPERRAGAYPHQLSGGQRQRAMIAMALACQPKLLLADEPTTALDVSLRGQILDLLSELQKRNGMAVLLITHDLNLVRRFADRVAVMQRGHLVEQGSVEAVFGAPKHAYTQKLLASRPERDVTETPEAAPAVMSAQGLRVSYPVALPGVTGWFKKGEFVAVQDASFEVFPGHTLGVIGESGSGKSTLALAALGLLPSRGTLTVAGKQWSHRYAADKPLREIIQVVFQDPFSSLSPRMTVQEIVDEGLRVHAPEVSPSERAERARQTLRDVGLDETQFPDLLSRYPHEFSGGQRQRIALARALIVQPDLLVLDEPTSALDVTIQKQVLDLLQRLQKERGLAYLLITHDVDVVRAMAHDVMVLKDGDVVESGSVQQVLESPQHPYTKRLLAAV